MRVVGHGDDFTILEAEEQLDWFRERMKDRYTLKVRGRLGPEVHDEKEIRILNRVIQWTEEGIWYEPDPRHAEIIFKDLGLIEGSKALSTPGVQQEVNEKEEELGCLLLTTRNQNCSKSSRLYSALRHYT